MSNASDYRSISSKGRIIKEHIHVAERILGRKLPKGAIVHHIDGNRRNNEPRNLVICPSQAYHKLLHNRMNAMALGFPAEWRMCHICKQWDAPHRLYFRKSRPGQWHRACAGILRKRRLQRSKACQPQ